MLGEGYLLSLRMGPVLEKWSLIAVNPVLSVLQGSPAEKKPPLCSFSNGQLSEMKSSSMIKRIQKCKGKINFCLIGEWIYFPGCKLFHQAQELFQRDTSKSEKLKSTWQTTAQTFTAVPSPHFNRIMKEQRTQSKLFRNKKILKPFYWSL